jgi:aryl-alcohol dehydrogenase-like predicted oxidoreductase
MDYRRLGSTGVRVSRPALGVRQFRRRGIGARVLRDGENEAQAFALMDRAHDAGINVFDTADACGGRRRKPSSVGG